MKTLTAMAVLIAALSNGAYAGGALDSLTGILPESNVEISVPKPHRDAQIIIDLQTGQYLPIVGGQRAQVRTQVILDPQTGQTHVVVPTGGGYIDTANGQYVPAVYTGSGYINSQTGQYWPVVGGQRAQVRTQVILDPQTGQTHVVIPTGGGYIDTANGQYVPAVYTGSGYINSQTGQYWPVVGGK